MEYAILDFIILINTNASFWECFWFITGLLIITGLLLMIFADKDPDEDEEDIYL